MPSIAQATISPHGKLKRRREDSDISVDVQAKLSSTLLPRHFQAPETALRFSADLSEESQHLERRYMHPKPRRLHDSKRQRLSLDASHPLEQREPLGHTLGNTVEQHTHDAGSRGEASRENRPKVDLNPCHICRRKPTVKKELDQYADCEGCGRRTCYICIRECMGSILGSPMLRDGRYDIEGDYDVLALSFHREENLYESRTRNGGERTDSGYGIGDEDGDEAKVWEKGKIVGHKRVVCSRCCVEKGTDGDVWCLGCLRAEDGI